MKKQNKHSWGKSSHAWGKSSARKYTTFVKCTKCGLQVAAFGSMPMSECPKSKAGE